MAMFLKIVGGLVALFILWALLRTPSEGDSEKSTQRRAISLCWDDQKKKSNAPAEARFIAGACEKMEADFRARWGVSP